MCLLYQVLLLFKSKLYLKPWKTQFSCYLFFASFHVFFFFFISVSSVFWWDHTCFSPHPPLWWVSSLRFLQAFLPQSIAHQAINTIICIGYIWADTLQSQKSKKKIYLGELFITERDALTQWNLDSSRIVICIQDAVCIKHFVKIIKTDYGSYPLL